MDAFSAVKRCSSSTTSLGLPRLPRIVSLQYPRGIELRKYNNVNGEKEMDSEGEKIIGGDQRGSCIVCVD
jgi:hypothetical protein